MEEIDEILTKLQNGTVTKAELEHLILLLDNSNILKKYLAELFQQNLNDIPSLYIPKEKADKLFQAIQLKKRTTISSNDQISISYPNKIYRFVAVAAACVVFLCSIIVFSHKDRAPQLSKISNRHSPVSQFLTTTYNSDGIIKKVLLNDGSMVTLYPHSSISCNQPFELHTRKIQLYGKAMFDVAKDKKRPFTVYSGKISTTAIGTSFIVDSKRALTTKVHLIHGKILVMSTDKSAQKLFLVTGESCIWHNATLEKESSFNNLAASTKNILSNIHAEKAEHSNTYTINKHTITFNNSPFSQVFTGLEKLYKVQIIKKDIPDSILNKGFYLGSFNMNKMSIETSLNIISNIAGLTWSQADSHTYNIYRK